MQQAWEVSAENWRRVQRKKLLIFPKVKKEKTHSMKDEEESRIMWGKSSVNRKNIPDFRNWL